MSAPTPPSTEQALLLDQLRAATLGEYDIYGELGRGGMATVFLAHEIALDRKVAIKVMAPGLLHGPGMVERFKREARTSANLAHPNIIPVYAVREAGGLLFFVMKLIEGTPLDSVMKELGQLPLPMVEAILAQVGGAFGYAHRHGVVHRDIKPSNILIDDEGWAVVTDFGIAKVKESEGLTQTGMAVGTPTYMSPEQCGGGEITGASDQYALGIVAYEMLAGRPPFTGVSTMALMFSHYHEAAPPLEGLRADCPERLRLAVMRMLEKDPQKRFDSMEEAIAAMGAKQLAHDDPTRSQLILLARSGTAHRVVSQVQTPRSPVPLTSRERPAVPTPVPVTTSTVAAPSPDRKWLIVAVGAVAAAAAAIVFTLSRPAGSVEANLPPALDSSAIPATQGTVQQQPPPPAPPAPAPAASTGTGREAVSPPPNRPAVQAPSNQPSSTAATPNPVPVPPPAPQPSAAPAPAPAPAPPPPPPAPEPVRSQPEARVVDERAEVTAAIMTYARALDQGDLAQVRRLYPAIPAEQRQGLEAFWKAGGTMRTRWSVTDVAVTGDEATAQVTGSNSVTQPRQSPSEQRVSLRARLVRQNGEWRLVSLVN